MLGSMTSAELTEWIADNSIEPIGPERSDLAAGIIAATVANCHRNPKTRPRPFEAQDFMAFTEKRVKMSTVEMISAMRGLAVLANQNGGDSGDDRKP